MATNTLSFPERHADGDAPAGAAVAVETRFKLIMFPATPGVHVMDSSTMPALRADCSDQARAIVAQVEWEIAQQAARKRVLEFRTKDEDPAIVRDTPWSVLRRVVQFLRRA